MSVKETKIVKYELVAPDGGWGYMIGVGVILNWITIAGFMNCVGMLFNDLFIEIDMDSTAITIFNGVGAFSVAVAGFLVSPLQKCMSLRQLGLLSAFIFNLGIFGTIFVKSKFQFIITQGIIQGFGNGLIYNLSCTMLNNYFVRRRMLAFSLTQLIAAASGMISPQFVKWSIEKYSSKGTLLLISAISLHNFFGMVLMQPVAWHMKKVEVLCTEEEDMKSLLKEDNKEVIKNYDNLSSSFKLNKMENITTDESSIKLFLSRIIDLSLLKTFVLSNACFGVGLCACLDIIFLMMLPQALYSMGWDESEVAMALSLNATADLVTRIVLILMNDILKKIGSHETYIGGVVIAFVSRIGILWSNKNTVVLVFITIMGISRCIIVLFMPVVIADSVDREKFTSAMGLMMLLFGLFNCTVGPVIGAIRDLTKSYSTAFYVLTSCFGVIVMTWSIELLYKKTKRKKLPKRDVSLKS